MRQIDSKLFVKLMQMEGEEDEFWFTDDCVVSEEGVKSTLPSSSLSNDADNRRTRSLLTQDERTVIDEVAEGLELALPCNYKGFREWVVRNDFDEVLDEADALFYRQYADEEDGKCAGDSESMAEVEPESESEVSKKNVAKKELAYTTWMREKWVEMGGPKGNGFFSGLKAFKGKEDSPVSDWYTVSKDGAGIKLVYSDGDIRHIDKKQVNKWASKFAKEKLSSNKNKKR